MLQDRRPADCGVFDDAGVWVRPFEVCVETAYGSVEKSMTRSGVLLIAQRVRMELLKLQEFRFRWRCLSEFKGLKGLSGYISLGGLRRWTTTAV